MTISQFLALFETQMQNGEYEGAHRSLNQLQTLGLDTMHLQLLKARLYDATDRTEEAEQLFRLVLKSNAPNAQILQARQGLNNIQVRQQERRKASIALEMTEARNQDDGLLLLFPIDVINKEAKAEALARVFNLDIYTARSVLPTRHHKIYRLGRYGEMKVYAQELQSYGIDCQAVRLKTIGEIPVYPVLYLAEAEDRLLITTTEKEFNIPWSSIKRIVKGDVPMLEEVVVGVNRKYQVVKEEQTKDYLTILDLHSDVIFRLENLEYLFSKGQQFPVENDTMTAKWQQLIHWIMERTRAVMIDDFLAFAEMSLLYPETLEKITPRLSFKRVKDCLWDNSFELYSYIFGRELCI